MKRKTTILLLVIAVFLFAATYLGCGGDNTKSDIPMNLFFEWSVTTNLFGMQNKDYFTWYNINCYLNYSDNLSSGYKFHYDQLDAGPLTVINDFEFKKDDGTIYQYRLEKPVKIFILAETASGKKGSYLKTW